jgi:hypothetical protein
MSTRQEQRVPLLLKWMTAVSLACAIPLCFAQVQVTGSNAKRIPDLLDQAESLPIEFRADLTLQVLSHAELKPMRLRRLLDDLFDAAKSAHDEYRIKDAIQIPDALAQERGLASAQNLDALSIRTRVIELMFKVNPSHALDLAEQLRIHLPHSGCDRDTVYDVSSYYKTLQTISGSTLSRAQAQQVHSLQLNTIAQMSNASKLVPAGSRSPNAPATLTNPNFRITVNQHLTRWPFGRVTEGLPTIREFTFDSANTCAFSGIRTTILGARNPPPIG